MQQNTHPQNPGGRLRIAVVGGGVAGITAAYMLQDSHDITLFEKNGYVGGHTNTIVIPDGPDCGTPVDTGFIVLNDRTYPVLNRFFKRLGVAICKSDMSFSYCCQKSGFQYASNSVNSLFAQRTNLIDPSYWAMLAQILYFNRKVTQKINNDTLNNLTLGQFIRRFRFSQRFRQQYLFPMVAAIWSAPDVEVDRFPMLTFAHFFRNHGLLAINDQPQWYFVSGGSHTYVQAFLQQFPGKVITHSAVAAIQRSAEGIAIHDSEGTLQRFDRVVIATHADEALRLLADPSDDERRLLGPWRYSVNQTYLHRDTSWMPSNPRAWASWNVIRKAGADQATPVTLTYHMNRLQRLHTQNQYLVTLNPFQPIPDDTIVASMTYTHPTFTFDSLRTQNELPRLNGQRNTFYCGSYFKYGFHEDAAKSGLAAAKAMGNGHEL